MTKGQAEKFRELLESNPDAQREVLHIVKQEQYLDVAGIGQKYGFEFSDETAEDVFVSSDGELSDFELELVAAASPSLCDDT